MARHTQQRLFSAVPRGGWLILGKRQQPFRWWVGGSSSSGVRRPRPTPPRSITAIRPSECTNSRVYPMAGLTPCTARDSWHSDTGCSVGTWMRARADRPGSVYTRIRFSFVVASAVTVSALRGPGQFQ